jgi:hypothetical protein
LTDVVAGGQPLAVKTVPARLELHKIPQHLPLAKLRWELLLQPCLHVL